MVKASFSNDPLFFLSPKFNSVLLIRQFVAFHCFFF